MTEFSVNDKKEQKAGSPCFFATVRVIGGGLAGSEAALKLSDLGHRVELWDTKPARMSAAHTSPLFGELVCSNSLKSDLANTPGGQLKREMRMLGSQLLRIAERVRVPSGGALAVDRAAFAEAITRELRARDNIELVCREYTELDDSVPTILATGPLTSDTLAQSIRARVGGENLSFFDAAAPIVDAESIDRNFCFTASRYGEGEGDYLNCPLTESEYYDFVDALTTAETAELKGFEGHEVFEGCMPIEVMAKRGADTLRFGPLKSAGLGDYFACVQLRSENTASTGYNLVGFQTNLKIGEQKRVFRMIPALRNAEFFRFGVMHRNSFLDAPRVLDRDLRLKGCDSIFVAGQFSGVEGYVESMASGLIAAIYLDRKIRGEEPIRLSRFSMLGAILSAIAIPSGNFQPVNANFGIMPPMPAAPKNKDSKYAAVCARATDAARDFCDKVFQEGTKIPL